MGEIIGVIGLGRMGWALAERLAGQGAEVVGWTRRGVDSDMAKAAGFESAADLSDCAARSDILMLSLFDDTAVEAILGQLAELDLSGKLIVETSTIAPDVVQRFEDRILAAGGRLIDAPISGGPEMVEAGTIGLFIGGAEDDVARFWPVGELASNRMARVGDLGMGATAKIVNNVALAGAFQSAVEALLLGQKLGLGLEVMLGFLAKSPGTTPMFKDRIAKITGEDEEVGFSVDGGVKDLTLFTGVAEAAGIDLSPPKRVRANFEKAQLAGIA
ncbi:MAG: NAD(P)-dependent oxidoreductase, partial [Boseongicola sp.]|nr:NAD(P)-dependent oxidoreductase [Boseongicola sp.]